MAASWMDFIDLQALGDDQLVRVVFDELFAKGEEDNSEVNSFSEGSADREEDEEDEESGESDGGNEGFEEEGT